jgi:HEAT repeat protein
LGLGSSLGLKAGEGGRTGRLFAYVFLLTAAAVLSRSAQREIFLAAYPRTAIPDAFLFAAGVLAAMSLTVSAVAQRLGLVRLMQWLLGAGAALLVGARLSLEVTPHAGAMIVYVVVEVMISMLLTQGWAVASEAVDVRAAKRLLPVVGLGAGIAWTVGGLAVGALARFVGPGALLLFAPVMLGLTAAMLEVIRRRDITVEKEPSRDAAGALGEVASGLKYLTTEPLVRLLALIITLELVVEKVTDLQLLAIAQERFAGQSGGIAAFMGLFYGLTGMVTLLAPLVTGRVLTKFGSTSAILVGQVWVFSLSLAFFFFPLFAVMVLLAGGDRVLKQALGAPARSQVFGALPSARRAQAGTLLRGVVAAVFSALAAVLLKALPESLPVHWLSLGAVCLMAVLVVLTRRDLRQGYLTALQRSVDRTRLDIDGVAEKQSLDREQAAMLAEELKNGDPQRGVSAVSILASSDPEHARPLLKQATAHPEPEVRARAVAALGKLSDPGDTAHLLEVLYAGEDTHVRSACLEALASMGDASQLAKLEPLLTTADPRVRALARVCRARWHEKANAPREVLQLELTALEAMLKSQVPDEREAAAWALGLVDLGDEGVREGFAPLLADASLPVRRAAIGASSRFNDESIVRALVFALEEPATSSAAFDAFTRLGDAGVDRVEKVIGDAPVEVVSRTASALSRGGGERATTVLHGLLKHDDHQVRYGASRALVLRRRGANWRAPDDGVVLGAIQADLKQGYRYYAALASLKQALSKGDAASQFVAGEIDARIQETERRLLALVAVIADPRIARLSHHLREASPQVVAKVLELVEQSLDPRLSELVVPFLEQARSGEKVAFGAQQFDVPQGFNTDTLAALVELGDPHLRLCALLAFKDAVSQRYPQLTAKEEPLLHLVEKLRFLRSVPIFKNMSPEDLMKLAEIAAPAEHHAGKIIFKKGDPGDVLCVVVKGKVEIRDSGHVIATELPNDFFGELALFDHEPRSADAVCIDDTELLEIGGADLESLMERRPEIAREIIRVLAKRLRRTTTEMVGRWGAAGAPAPSAPPPPARK